jgi:hypothetical protein
MDFSWLIRSSSDPRNTSLAVKGALLAIMPAALYLTGIAEADFNVIVDAAVTIVFAVTSIISAAQIIYGIVRKVKLGRWSASE